MCKKKLFFEECPKQQCNELDNESFKMMEYFYNSSYKSSFVNKIIFDIAFSADRTLLNFIDVIFTSFSFNLSTIINNIYILYFTD